MNTSTGRWLIPVAVVIASCYLIPYTVLRDVDAWYGSFLFWSLATAVVIAINAIVSMKWKD